MSVVIENIAEEHAEEAAFLWLLRDAAVSAPNYDLDDLAELDGRIEAHLEGLRVAGAGGWAAVAEQLKFEEPGEVFAAGVVALETGDPAKLEVVLPIALATPENGRGLVSALGWVDKKRLRGTVKALLADDDPAHRAIGIAACAVQRTDPGPALDAAVADPDPSLRAQALRSAGLLKRADLRPAIAKAYGDEDDACRFWAAWSGALLKDPAAVARLRAFARPGSPFAPRAFDMALRAMPPAEATAWLKQIGRVAELGRLVVIGIGVIGDPAAVPWLLKQMAVPERARIAGEAVAAITGLDISIEGLEAEPPEDFEAGPTEDPEDENVAPDPDEDLPWSDPDKLAAWWAANKGRFQPGRRHLLGVPIAPEPLQQVLRGGPQRQRAAAALELALAKPDGPLFETRAPAARQKAHLASG